MRKEEYAEVVVVGAGPVGMTAALCLVQRGKQVLLLDQAWRRSSRSYACALHPSALRLMRELGLADELLKIGRRIERIAFYEEHARRAEVNLAGTDAEFPFLLLAPQSELELLLENRLRAQPRALLLWNHRVTAINQQADGAWAVVEKLAETATGYMVPSWDWVVERTFSAKAYHLVGADGRHSVVRRELAIGEDTRQTSELFEIYEFEVEGEPPAEAAVAWETGRTSILWPLSGSRCRWAFQVASGPEAEEFPVKDREPVEYVEEGQPAAREQLRGHLKERAPWFKPAVGEIVWHGHAQFQPWLATRWGFDRCWLAGDAAHQTGPAGMQSMNAGLLEARDLADAIAQAQENPDAAQALTAYERRHREKWRGLLGGAESLRSGPETAAWADRNAARLLSCLPGTGAELVPLAARLGLAFAPPACEPARGGG